MVVVAMIMKNLRVWFTMSSREIRRLNVICQFIEQNTPVSEFELRHHFGISRSLYSQIKADLKEGHMFTWKVKFDKKTKMWYWVDKREEIV